MAGHGAWGSGAGGGAPRPPAQVSVSRHLPASWGLSVFAQQWGSCPPSSICPSSTHPPSICPPAARPSTLPQPSGFAERRPRVTCWAEPQRRVQNDKPVAGVDGVWSLPVGAAGHWGGGCPAGDCSPAEADAGPSVPGEPVALGCSEGWGFGLGGRRQHSGPSPAPALWGDPGLVLVLGSHEAPPDGRAPDCTHGPRILMPLFVSTSGVSQIVKDLASLVSARGDAICGFPGRPPNPGPGVGEAQGGSWGSEHCRLLPTCQAVLPPKDVTG